MNFKSWKKRVDSILMDIVCMPSDCLPDANWKNYYDSEMSVDEAILLACENDWQYEYSLSSLIKEAYND